MEIALSNSAINGSPSYKFKNNTHAYLVISSEMEQDPVVYAPHVPSLPFVCGKTVAKE